MNCLRNKSISIIKVSPFILLLLMLNACGFKDLSISEVSNVSMTNLTDKGVEISFDIHIKNPNGFNIKVTRSKFDVKINNTKLGNAHLRDKITIPKHSDKTYTISIVADGSELTKAAVPALLGLIAKRGLPLEIKGFIKGRAYLILSKKVPVEYKDFVKVFGS